MSPKQVLCFGILLCLIVCLQGQTTTRRNRLGGFSILSANQKSNARVQNAILVGKDYLVANTTSASCRESLSEQKVERQNARGHNYRMTFEVVETSACSNQPGNVGKTCIVTVHDNARRKTTVAVRGSCQ